MSKACVEPSVIEPVLLDYFDENGPGGMVGQTMAIHFALIPRLFAATGIHFNLTIGWMVRNGKEHLRHDETLIQTFIDARSEAWITLGCPFHL